MSTKQYRNNIPLSLCHAAVLAYDLDSSQFIAASRKILDDALHTHPHPMDALNAAWLTATTITQRWPEVVRAQENEIAKHLNELRLYAIHVMDRCLPKATELIAQKPNHSDNLVQRARDFVLAHTPAGLTG